MIDYKQWISRAVSFLERARALPGHVDVVIEVEPPLSKEDLRRLRLDAIPDSLTAFLTRGSRNCHCSYTWYPAGKPADESVLRASGGVLPHIHGLFPGYTRVDGGPELCNAATMYQDRDMVLGFSEGWPSEYREMCELWKECYPFIDMGNGDFVAIRETTGEVMYLDHDDIEYCKVFGSSFDAFLMAWEKLYYLAPDILQQLCTREESKSLNSESKESRRWGELMSRLLGEQA